MSNKKNFENYLITWKLNNFTFHTLVSLQIIEIFRLLQFTFEQPIDQDRNQEVNLKLS